MHTHVPVQAWTHLHSSWAPARFLSRCRRFPPAAYLLPAGRLRCLLCAGPWAHSHKDGRWCPMLWDGQSLSPQQAELAPHSKSRRGPVCGDEHPPHTPGNRFGGTERLGPTVPEFRSQAFRGRHPAWLGQPAPARNGPQEGPLWAPGADSAGQSLRLGLHPAAPPHCSPH